MKLIFALIIILKTTEALLPFPSGTTNGYVVAVAFPIDLPGRNTYVSYNFEANYVLPTRSTDFTEGLYDKVLFVDGVDAADADEKVEDDESEIITRNIKSFNLLSRKNLYELIEYKMGDYGLNGHACLLKIICEVSNSNFYETNGVFGSLFHILLTPSSSSPEDDMTDYLKAETSGGNCTSFTTKCSASLLNSFSVVWK